MLKKLGYSIKEAVSCTADQVYEKYGKSMFDKREIKRLKINKKLHQNQPSFLSISRIFFFDLNQN